MYVWCSNSIFIHCHIWSDMLFIRFASECSRMSLARRGEGGWSRGSVLLVRPPKFVWLWRALLPIFFTTNLPSSLPFFLPSHFPQTHFRLRGILVSTPATFFLQWPKFAPSIWSKRFRLEWTQRSYFQTRMKDRLLEGSRIRRVIRPFISLASLSTAF